jgi:hypothetical protein
VTEQAKLCKCFCVELKEYSFNLTNFNPLLKAHNPKSIYKTYNPNDV